jgi:hypothetical protein
VVEVAGWKAVVAACNVDDAGWVVEGADSVFEVVR